MTPQMQQNPLLERHERGVGEVVPPGDAGAAERPAPGDLPERLTGDFTPDAAEHWQPEWGEEGDRAVDFGGEPQLWSGRNGAQGAAYRPELDQTATRPRTLREHLLEQIGADLSDQGDRVISVLLLDLLDEAGYLRAPLDGVAQLLGCETGRIESVLARLQQFDPAGVFARDLKECLALQLRDRNRFDPAMQALLDNLPLVAHLNVAALLRICGVDADDLADMVAEI